MRTTDNRFHYLHLLNSCYNLINSIQQLAFGVCFSFFIILGNLSSSRTFFLLSEINLKPSNFIIHTYVKIASFFFGRNHFYFSNVITFYVMPKAISEARGSFVECVQRFN